MTEGIHYNASPHDANCMYERAAAQELSKLTCWCEMHTLVGYQVWNWTSGHSMYSKC